MSTRLPCLIALTLNTVMSMPAIAADESKLAPKSLQAEQGEISDKIDFFEKNIRPVLVEHCYRCHSDAQKKSKGGLRVDGRAQLLTGGDNGAAIVPGEPAKSRLIEAVRYGNADLQMPPKGKIPDAAIKDLERWVKDGAVWPEEKTTTKTASDFDLPGRKKTHWSWRSIVRPEVPAVAAADKAWANDPIDAFILAKIKAKNLAPAAPADNHTWLRRVSFLITGLPPTPAEIEQFLADDKPTARETVVDRLLASPQFGERWARHWLDLVRYAESRGHEFEPDIPNAFQYRDYVIRAFNADVPYDQLVREHLAGDMLPKPRLHPKDGNNESIIGSGFWHLGEEVHSPVDIRQDQADRFDNRIDVMTKSFLGLTVACARCHDHKFDAISTKDYYALFGLLEGSSYRLARTDGWEQNRAAARELLKLRQETAKALLKDELHPPAAKPNDKHSDWLNKASVIIDYSKLEPGHWLPDDVSFGEGPRRAGTASIRWTKDTPSIHLEPRTAAVYDRFWAGMTSASPKDVGGLGRMPRQGNSIRTANVLLEKKNLYYLVRGGGMAYAGVDHHIVLAGPLHGGLVTSFPNTADYRWVAHNVAGYVGQRVQVEFTADPKTDFAVAMVVQADEPPPGVPPAESPTTAPVPENFADVAKKFLADEKAISAKVKWDSRLVLALWNGPGVDGKVFLRGNPRTVGADVPRRTLEALQSNEQPLPPGSDFDRYALAVHLTNPKENPYAARVAVNRLWHHMFGRGIVPSTDNFGVLGEAPTHPELLDYLAEEFVKDGWSMKKMIRRLALTGTFGMSSVSDAAADTADPTNSLLHKYPLRRLEGEAIRDTMLAISGRLDPRLGGPSVPIHLTPFLDGRGRPASGPLDGGGRRSIYLAVRRNFLSPFLLTFDTPIPFSTVGRRQVSNVPAQALIVLNDPFVHTQAEIWAKSVLAKPGTSTERLRGMYLTAYGRPARDEEIETCLGFLKGQETDPKSWSELAHAMMTVKDFIYIR